MDVCKFRPFFWPVFLLAQSFYQSFTVHLPPSLMTLSRQYNNQLTPALGCLNFLFISSLINFLFEVYCAVIGSLR